MKRTRCLILALLFLLPACSRQAKDDDYHWTPPEKKIAQTAVDDGYDPAKYEIRLPGGTVLPEEEWNAYFENLPINAGYVMEITLDSGKNYAAFLEYRAAAMAEPQTAKTMYERVYKSYEKAIADQVKVARLNMPQILEEIAADGEIDEWVVIGPTPGIEIRPLRVAGG